MTNDPNLTGTEDPAAECLHMVLKRSKVGPTVMWRCQDCKRLFSLEPFKITVIPPRI